MTAARERSTRAGQLVVVALRPSDESLLDAIRGAGLSVLDSAPEEFDESLAEGLGAAAVVDIDLPGSLATLHRLRRGGAGGAQVPVVVVGVRQDAHASSATLHPAMQAGADAFLARPVVADELVEQLELLLDGGRPPRATGRFTAPPRSLSGTNRATVGAPPTPPSQPTRSTLSSSRLTAVSAERVDDAPPPTQQPTLPAQARTSAPADAFPLEPFRDTSSVSSVLRLAVEEAFAAEGVDGGFELPPLLDDDLDDLVPPELLEPLDGPMDSFDQDLSLGAAQATLADAQVTASVGARRVTGRNVLVSAPLMPLTIDGDLRLAGNLGRYGVAQLLAAAWRGRSTGVIALHSEGTEWALTLNAGHLLAVRGSRPDDLIGPMLARLGFIPREAARFAHVPLDAGLRGAALLAAQGYLSPDGIAPILARAAQEMIFDLLCLDRAEWELRAVEHAVGVPLPTRALDALLILGARARLEPAQAFLALGGDDTTASLRAEASSLLALPLTPQERDAAAAARGTSLAALVRSHGEAVLPALLGLSWLQLLRLEGMAHQLGVAQGLPGAERTRVRALIEAAERKDLLALLGISPWATQRAALIALETRRGELDELRARHGVTQVLLPVYAALDEADSMIEDAGAWDRYASVLRYAPRDEL